MYVCESVRDVASKLDTERRKGVTSQEEDISVMSMRVNKLYTVPLELLPYVCVSRDRTGE